MEERSPNKCEALGSIPNAAKNSSKKKYLKIPNCHGSIDASSAEFPTVLLVHLINRHLTKEATSRDCEVCGEVSPTLTYYKVHERK